MKYFLFTNEKKEEGQILTKHTNKILFEEKKKKRDRIAAEIFMEGR